MTKTTKSKKNTKQKLITAKMTEGEFPLFEDGKKRISRISNDYADYSISDAFNRYYQVKSSHKVDDAMNEVTPIVIGDVYLGTVKELDKGILTFDIPGVNEELVCMENMNPYLDHLREYCMKNDNKLYFEVREKRGNKYMVNVSNAYYRIWAQMVMADAKEGQGIEVHIDSLVKGGYVCHTPITILNDLLGTEYTSSVFIPGSQIVLNIERDFERWVGQDVTIIPQKFVDFRIDRRAGLCEKSLIGSRQRVLEMKGDYNMLQLYQSWQLAQNGKVTVNTTPLEGKVTGVICSTKKTGVFIEITDKYFTGMLPVEHASDLVNYKPGDNILVNIKDFEVQEGKQAFTMDKTGTKIYKRNCRPVFELA